MNAQPNVQRFNSNKHPLFTVTGQEGPFDASAQHQMCVLGDKPQSDTGVAMHPAAGQQIGFVARIRALIEAHIDDESYSIDQLCRDAGASRSQLHNKLKKWTGLSTSYFIRSVKLQKAKYLLVQTDLNITQVAFEVGFRAPGYFTRVFCESFGVSPKNFRKRWQKAYTEV